MSDGANPPWSYQRVPLDTAVYDEIERQLDVAMAEIQRVETERMWGAWPDLPPPDADGDITIYPTAGRRPAPA